MSTDRSRQSGNFDSPPITLIKLGSWGKACHSMGTLFLTKTEGSWTPVPTILMNEAVRIQVSETKAHRVNLPHSREYEICYRSVSDILHITRLNGMWTYGDTENGDNETPPYTTDPVR